MSALSFLSHSQEQKVVFVHQNGFVHEDVGYDHPRPARRGETRYASTRPKRRVKWTSLNQLFQDGWKLVSIHPFPEPSKIKPKLAFLVVLERNSQK